MANVMDIIYEKAKSNPQRIAFPEASNEKMMQAATLCIYMQPVCSEELK